jgi:hypothetical protein
VRTYLVRLLESAAATRWAVVGEHVEDPDVWVVIQEFVFRADAQHYLRVVRKRQEEQEGRH